MPKLASQRTFSACWTCRRRNVRCDTARPSCSQCGRLSLVCEGYDMRLVWVDQQTGAYTPLQRRTYPCSTTWSGYPTWTSKELDHLLEECDRQQCRCGLHQVPCPFVTFSQYEDEQSGHSGWLSLRTNPAGETQAGDLVLLQEKIRLDTSPSVSEILHSNVSSFKAFDLWHGSAEVSRIYEPSHLQGQSDDENRIFYHYVSYLSTQMVPIDFDNNPWKSTYPSMAAQECLAGSGSLYYALIAFSALHLANLKGPIAESSREVAIATHYYGLALRGIRESLSQPADNSYDLVLASMLVMTLAEHGFEGMCRGWRVHLVGALQFVIRNYRAQNSWTKSQDDWDQTQALVMFAIIAQTTNNTKKRSIIWLEEFLPVLHSVMEHRSFGYLVGGNARLLNAIYQVQYLEAQAAADRVSKGTKTNRSMRNQAEKIIQELHVAACEDDIDMYLSGSQPVSNRDASLPKRSQVKMHLDLFAASVLIYCQTRLLGSHPSAVVGYVYQVLSYANTLMEDDCGAVFIWSVFIAAVEAYTPEARALASTFFCRAEKRGGPNRKAMHQIICQVWADREQLASDERCDPGGVSVDWRRVMKNLGVDILLL